MPVITEPSICIPRTLNNVGWRDVKACFEDLVGRGTVERVDIVVPRDGDRSFCKIFVHFRYWPDTEQSKDVRTRLLGGEELKVWYDFPRFWKCSTSRTVKPERNGSKVAPYIEPSLPPKLERQNGGSDDDVYSGETYLKFEKEEELRETASDA